MHNQTRDTAVLQKLEAARRRESRWEVLRRLYPALRRVVALGLVVSRDLNHSAGLDRRQSLRAWRHGFSRHDFRLYGLHRAGRPEEYLSSLQVLRTTFINDRHFELVNNKLACNALMRHLDIPCPAIFGVIRKGVVHLLKDGSHYLSQDIPKYLPAATTLVIKPIWGQHGRGFIRLSRDNETVSLNGLPCAPKQLESMLTGLNDCLITEFIRQGTFSRRLYPETTNTLRLVTFWDPQQQEAFLVRAVQRVGTSRSFPVDNFSGGRGGLSVMVDPDTGRLGQGADVTGSGQVDWHSRHPETGTRIEGVRIPEWSKLHRDVIGHANRLAFAPCQAWDIVLTESGYSVIETNSRPGMPVLQVHGPLLNDPRVTRFYRHHHVIS